MADVRIKLDTVNSEKLSEIAKATNQEIKDIIGPILDEKLKYLQISELTVADSNLLEKLSKYQSATRELVLSFIQEKEVDSDNLQTEYKKEVSHKQETIDALTSDIKKKEEEITSLSNKYDEVCNKLKASEKELEIVKKENEALRNNKQQLDNIIKLLTPKGSENESSTLS